MPTPDPKQYQFDLDPAARPADESIPELWYPGVRELWPICTTRRSGHVIDSITAVVIHATAGSSSAGAVSSMRAGKASFHWLVPDEDEPQHGNTIWACVPEALAAWHVRNPVFHSDVNGGKNKVNHWSLGIEMVNTVAGDPYSDWQVEVTAKIVRYCWAKYPNLRYVVSHAKLDPTRRTDPGSVFPWEKFRRLVVRTTGPEIRAALRGAVPASRLRRSLPSGDLCQ